MTAFYFNGVMSGLISESAARNDITEHTEHTRLTLLNLGYTRRTLVSELTCARWHEICH